MWIGFAPLSDFFFLGGGFFFLLFRFSLLHKCFSFLLVVLRVSDVFHKEKKSLRCLVGGGWMIGYVFRLEVEVVLCVVVADVFHHLLQAGHLGGWQFAVFHVFSEEVAECPAEVFVPRVGEE